MELMQVKAPENDYRYGKPEALSEYDVERLEEVGVNFAAYYYLEGGYEGSGSIIFHNKDGWRHHDMGHCSCYGPLDNGWQHTKAFTTLDELIASFSDELKKENAPIIEALAERPRPQF